MRIFSLQLDHLIPALTALAAELISNNLEENDIEQAAIRVLVEQ